jgi:hypothetical protein
MNTSTSSSTKNLLISVGIILAAVLGYYVFSPDFSSNSDSLLQESSQDNLAGAQVLSLLNQIGSLQIDANFFKGAAFTSLQDYSVAIPPQTVGRPNPFAPLPGLKSVTPSR